jgi:carboxymethylenebutenolidase
MTSRHMLASGLPLNVAGTPDRPRAVIVLQEAFGVNDHIRRVTDDFAAHGYYAVCPELFHRDGSPEVPYEDFAQAMTALGNLTREGLAADLTDAAAFLRAAGYDAATIGVVGYCMGGTVATFAGTLGLVGAVASFYGGGVVNGRFGLDPLTDMLGTLSCPWIGLYGELDKGIPAEHIEALRAAMARSSRAADHVLHYYPNADHGFHCTDRTAVFEPVTAALAETATYEFFAATLRSR